MSDDDFPGVGFGLGCLLVVLGAIVGFVVGGIIGVQLFGLFLSDYGDDLSKGEKAFGLQVVGAILGAVVFLLLGVGLERISRPRSRGSEKE